jgi:hypothetical protein
LVFFAVLTFACLLAAASYPASASSQRQRQRRQRHACPSSRLTANSLSPSQIDHPLVPLFLSLFCFLLSPVCVSCVLCARLRFGLCLDRHREGSIVFVVQRGVLVQFSRLCVFVSQWMLASLKSIAIWHSRLVSPLANPRGENACESGPGAPRSLANSQNCAATLIERQFTHTGFT